MESSCTAAFAGDPTIALLLVGAALVMVLWQRRRRALWAAENCETTIGGDVPAFYKD